MYFDNQILYSWTVGYRTEASIYRTIEYRSGKNLSEPISAAQ